MDWFKFYGGDYLSDPKISSLTPQERSCWVNLLCMASAEDKGGIIEFLTVEVLLTKSGIVWDPYHPEEWDKCLGVLDKLERMRMIQRKEDGSIEVLNWKKRQEHNLTAAERQAKYRAKVKNSNEIVTGRVTKVTLDKSRVDKSRIEYTTDFMEFWVKYPKKVGKPIAFTLWLKLNPDDRVAIMGDLELRKSDKKWVDGFIKDPQRYLKYRQWEDEIIREESTTKVWDFSKVK